MKRSSKGLHGRAGAAIEQVHAGRLDGRHGEEMDAVKSVASNLVFACSIFIAVSSCSGLGTPRSEPDYTPHAIASTGKSAIASLQPCVGPGPKIPIKHVFLIVLENKSYDRTFAPGSGLRRLAAQGVLLTNYWGIGHNSLDNYLAMISGQAPNPVTQMDCPVFVDIKKPDEVKHQLAQHFERLRLAAERHIRSLAWHSDEAEKDAITKTSKLVDTERSNMSQELPPDLVPGAGCIYSADVRTIADQLDERTPGHGWRAYMEGMQRPCDHPEPGTIDGSTLPFLPNPRHYTPRHNPFVYFRSLLGRDEHHPRGSCDQFDRPLGDLNGATDGLTKDLRNNDVPRFVFISPNLCNDGHSDCLHPDEKDPARKRADEMSAIDEFVPKLVALIKKSDAYRNGGMIVVTFDEAEVPEIPQTISYLPEDEDHDEDPNPAPDWAKSCCDEKPGPMWNYPGLWGPGGGKVGAIVISPFIKQGSEDGHEYNHYSLLRTLEDLFDLRRQGAASVEHLGYAAPNGLNTFQACDVFNQLPEGSQAASFTK